MKTIALATALTVAVSAPAFANEQLANGLGIDASQYTTAQIAALRAATADDERAAANYIRKNGGASGATVSTKSFGSNDRATEIAIQSALASDERASARSLQKSASGVTVSTKSVGTSAGQRQLAASLGVDPADYTLAELVHLKGVQSSDNGRGE
ncbi:hypothetical protein CLV78_104180 [Aliiruegeria haliotis]|uniref:Uncharacterized protein n=1 Tax=Aliiruegeria haliotis TaxID=1280846 RepID=A0A2T0RR69_9RHOB|nr:hypothetical protein [Aliiruegeria haliotis]PRY23689.1 hypothetical protein CLV78_104180 [Aliiruegeria haliotis]